MPTATPKSQVPYIRSNHSSGDSDTKVPNSLVNNDIGTAKLKSKVPMEADDGTVTKFHHVHSPQFGYKSQKMICPHCHISIKTRTKKVKGTVNWVLCWLMCALPCLWPCCCAPCCIDAMKVVSYIFLLDLIKLNDS